MMKTLSFFSSALLCATVPAVADIVLKQPVRNEVITTMAPELREYLEKPAAERIEIFNNKKKRAALRKVRDARPHPFVWECTGAEAGDFSVVISTNADFSDSAPALVLSGGAEGKSHHADVANLPIGATFHWKVVCQTADGGRLESEPAVFRTDSFAPRLLLLPKVGNVRDLGGRPGLDGRMIRQGMIYRSAGLNENSPDFRDKEKKDPDTFRIGAMRIRPEAAAFATGTLGWKTELDLRSHGEVGPMKQSPLGLEVCWIHNSASAYAGIFDKNGSKAMLASFRVFLDPQNYPVNFHCIAGADRTGALAYILNGLLGVDPDELAKDWEITANEYFDYQRHFARMIAGFDRFGGPEVPMVRKIEAYLREIGVTDGEIAAFRSIMLADKPD